jgi:hypothetical protein
MSGRTRRLEGKGAIDLLEEAVHLVRLAPPGVLLSYYAGSLPFVLGFLYFWADMSRSAFADRHCAEAALLVSLLFIWMKCWHAVFSRQLRARLGGEPPPRWSLRRILRLIGAQTALQPPGLLLLPAALLATLPFGWVYAFYQNVTVFGEGEAQDLRAAYRKSRKQAMLFASQNHVILLVLSLFGTVVFLNLAVVLYLLPRLVHMLFGTESLFTRAGGYLLNTTFLAVVCGMTYLAVDPLVKAVYALRCFYGESLTTGEDLIAELKNARTALRTEAAALLFLLVWTCAGAASVMAAETMPRNTAEPGNSVAALFSGTVSPPEINRSIDKVMSRREYAWRMPREKRDDHKEKGLIATFIDGAIDAVTGWLAPVKKWIGHVMEWIIEHLFSPFRMEPRVGGLEFGWSPSIMILLYGLLGLTASILAVTFWRMWRERRSGRPVPTMKGEALSPELRLAGGNVSADELPAARWLELGRQWMEKGDLRLALRAFYLASLSHLAEQGSFTIAPFKSNREYVQELRRKARGVPDLLSAFSQNVSLIERIWYGTDEVTAETVSSFNSNQERIMAHAEAR